VALIEFYKKIGEFIKGQRAKLRNVQNVKQSDCPKNRSLPSKAVKKKRARVGRKQQEIIRQTRPAKRRLRLATSSITGG
jgi:hypothetical protein